MPLSRSFARSLVIVSSWSSARSVCPCQSSTSTIGRRRRHEPFRCSQRHASAPLGQGLLQERWEGLGCGHVFGLLARDMIAPLALMRKSAWFCRPISSTRSHLAPAALWAFRTCPLLTSPRQSPSMLVRLGRNSFSPSLLRPSDRDRPVVVDPARAEDGEGDARQLVGERHRRQPEGVLEPALAFEQTGDPTPQRIFVAAR